MENPNFTFVIGDPAEDATGRSAQGRVLLEENRWHFEADLVRRWSPKRYQFNRIALTIERPFDIFEFCFFYTMVSSGRFETNTGTSRICAASQTDLPIVQAVQRAGFKVPQELDDLSAAFIEDIARMEAELDHLRKTEMLQLASATRQPGDGVSILLES